MDKMDNHGYCHKEEIVKNKKYWSNVFAMLGVAFVAAAVFRDNWLPGLAIGTYFIIWGNTLSGE